MGAEFDKEPDDKPFDLREDFLAEVREYRCRAWHLKKRCRGWKRPLRLPFAALFFTAFWGALLILVLGMLALAVAFSPLLLVALGLKWQTEAVQNGYRGL